MSNPQLETLKKLGELQKLENDIIYILNKYSNIAPLCSHEILGLANYETISAIAKCSQSNAGGFSIPSSWIGSVSSYMAKQNRLKQTISHCKYKGQDDEFWQL